MTTTRDAIAGLSERLRERTTRLGSSSPDAVLHFMNGILPLLEASAAAIDALQARVKELEERVHYAEGTADLAMKHRDSAEQERDEAYERAVQAIRSAPTPDANGYVVTKDAAIKAILRLSAGPEKEG